MWPWPLDGAGRHRPTHGRQPANFRTAHSLHGELDRTCWRQRTAAHPQTEGEERASAKAAAPWQTRIARTRQRHWQEKAAEWQGWLKDGEAEVAEASPARQAESRACCVEVARVHRDLGKKP